MKLVRGILVLLLALAASTVCAQGWPSRPVRVIVGLGPGGVTDVVARAFAEELGKRLGQSFIVENRPGASGLIGATAVKNARPDGYTLFSGSSTSFNPVFHKGEGLDAGKELQPISNLVVGNQFIYVRSSLGVGTIKELVERSKAGAPLKHAGISTAQHMLTFIVAKQLGFAFENIPYKTTDQAITALLSGDTDFAVSSLPGFQPHIDAGKLRVLVSLMPVRSPSMPDVPALKELGVTAEARFSINLWAPLGTPREVIMKLNDAVGHVAKVPALVERFKAFALEMDPSTPEELMQLFQRQIAVYVEAASMLGMTK